MIRTVSMFRFAAAVVAAAWGATAAGAPINHGTFVGNTVQYVDVTEDSGTDPLPPALYGAPNIAGDTLDFSPVSFNSSSTGALGVDQTDGTLTMRIEALPGNSIPVLMIEEAGDYTLTGVGAGTGAAITAYFYLDIIEVDGVSINPVKLSGQLTVTGGGQFGPSPAGGIWTGNLSFDVSAALTANNVPYVGGATKVTLTLDNNLATVSEAGTIATIAKKDAGVRITVPEPSSMGLAAACAGLVGFAIRRRRAA